ncbi:MAG: PilX N-terminal domain-containing pilus assembly protein [Gammaproteobacteria bacterium]
MSIPAAPLPREQSGAILALGLVLLLIVSTLATSGMSNATLEMVKSDSSVVTDDAFFAAESGIANALANGDFSNTRGSNLPRLLLQGGSSAQANIRYLGLIFPDPADPLTGLAAWHFVIESTSRSARGARARHVLQVRVVAPPPPDESACLVAGCDLPPICPPLPDDCARPLRAEPRGVSWHVMGILP